MPITVRNIPRVTRQLNRFRRDVTTGYGSRLIKQRVARTYLPFFKRALPARTGRLRSSAIANFLGIIIGAPYVLYVFGSRSIRRVINNSRASFLAGTRGTRIAQRRANRFVRG